MEKVNLAEKFALFDDHWSPRIVGELNGQYVKLARLRGEFIWHQHIAEDELFMVIQGELVIRLPGKEITLSAGEFLVVPRSVDHCPVAAEEALVLLFEPKETVRTGNVQPNKSVEDAAWI